MEKLIASCKLGEGFRDKIYPDTEGNPTCGWGHYLRLGSKVPLEACEAFFKQDIADAVASYRTILPHLRKKLNTSRARVITEMIFNMGLTHVLQFRKMWEAIEKEDFEEAAAQMMDSHWSEDVGDGPGKRFDRAERLSQIMRLGFDREEELAELTRKVE
mgnify:CR=1 FL=1